MYQSDIYLSNPTLHFGKNFWPLLDCNCVFINKGLQIKQLFALI